MPSTVLHHVALEVSGSDLARGRQFWGILGLREIEPPGSLRRRAVWLESRGEPRTQIHLMITEDPVAPPKGHAALVVDDYEAVVGRLREFGFEVTDRRPHWGSPRCYCAHPGGHTVELMYEPPPAV